MQQPPSNLPEMQPNTNSSIPTEAPTPTKHVFLSYSRRDGEVMGRLRDTLRGQNIPVWTDENITPGQPIWEIAIEQALENAFCVMVILSPDAKASPWVRRELEYAQTLQRAIFPVLWRGEVIESIPFNVMATQFVDLRTEFAQGVTQLISTIRQSMQQPISTPAPVTVPALVRPSEYRLDNNAWMMLLDRVNKGRCTPFIGPGVCEDLLPGESIIARQWAAKHDLPITQSDDLTAVAQFLAMEFSPGYIKEQILDTWLKDSSASIGKLSTSRYAVLADLNLPVYITANYDDLMSEALLLAQRLPTRVLYDDPPESVTLDASPDKPIVYHLYGHYSSPASVVMTEDDYLDYLVRVSKSTSPFPAAILKRFATTTLLFLGFTLTSWNFRVLYRILGDYLRPNQSNTHVAVQVAPGAGAFSEIQVKRLNEFLKRYFGRLQTHIYVGSPDEFIDEMKQRREKQS